MTITKVDKKSEETHVLDAATQALLTSIEKKDARFRRWLLVFWTLLLIVAVIGIFNQDVIANNNKQHIDCVVKLFTSPNRGQKIITDPNGRCNIQFSPAQIDNE